MITMTDYLDVNVNMARCNNIILRRRVDGEVEKMASRSIKREDDMMGVEQRTETNREFFLNHTKESHKLRFYSRRVMNMTPRMPPE